MGDNPISTVSFHKIYFRIHSLWKRGWVYGNLLNRSPYRLSYLNFNSWFKHTNRLSIFSYTTWYLYSFLYRFLNAVRRHIYVRSWIGSGPSFLFFSFFLIYIKTVFCYFYLFCPLFFIYTSVVNVAHNYSAYFYLCFICFPLIFFYS